MREGRMRHIISPFYGIESVVSIKYTNGVEDECAYGFLQFSWCLYMEINFHMAIVEPLLFWSQRRHRSTM